MKANAKTKRPAVAIELTDKILELERRLSKAEELFNAQASQAETYRAETHRFKEALKQSEAARDAFEARAQQWKNVAMKMI